jgi:integrase
MSVPTSLFLFKRSNGIFYVCLQVDGKRRWKSTKCTDKASALKKVSCLAELMTPKERPVMLQQFIADFMPFAEGTFDVETIGCYRRSLDQFLTLAGNIRLDSLTLKHLDRYKIERLKFKVHDRRPISPATVNRELQALHAAMQRAVTWKVISANPFAGMQQIPIPDRSPLFFSRLEFEKLFAIVKEEWFKELILFAVCTGLRQGEMLNLQWKQVDLTNKLFRLESSPTFKMKGGKRRTVPISDAIYGVLQSKYLGDDNAYVFTFEGGRIKPSLVIHKFKKYVLLAGVNERLHWHSLRATYASWLVACNVPIFAVSKLLGHSSVQVTERAYAALAPESLHAEVNRIQLSLN